MVAEALQNAAAARLCKALVTWAPRINELAIMRSAAAAP